MLLNQRQSSDYDLDNDGLIDLIAGGLNLDLSALSGILKVSGGVASALNSDITAAELEELTDGSVTTKHSHASAALDYSDISGNDAATDVTAAELEELTDGSVTSKHSHADPTLDYSDISGNDAATDVTGAQLEELTDGSETTLHSHAAGSGGTFVGRGDPTTKDFAIGDLGAQGSFNDLDLSSIVPEGAKAVLLYVEFNNSTTGKTVQLRKNGQTNGINVWYKETLFAGGSMFDEAVVELDSNRYIETFYGGGGVWNTFYISVRGWWT
jgi:hypothetical protein